MRMASAAYQADTPHTSSMANRPDMPDRTAMDAMMNPWNLDGIAWALDESYMPDDYVLHNLLAYRAIRHHTSTAYLEPGNPTYWDGPLSTFVWAASVPYLAGAFVSILADTAPVPTIAPDIPSYAEEDARFSFAAAAGFEFYNSSLPTLGDATIDVYMIGQIEIISLLDSALIIYLTGATGCGFFIRGWRHSR